MAKKSRTPSPPRKVQAPKRRDQPRSSRAPQVGTDRTRLYLVLFAAAGVIAVIVVVAVILTSRNSTSGGPPGEVGVPVPNLATLPGVQMGPPPWPAEESKLSARAAILGIPANTRETLQVHYHAHLDIYDNGQPVTVPAFIGISQQERVITALHTHDTAGFIHIESPIVYNYTLGQFFGIWGLNLSKKCIGGLCKEPLRVWANGHPFRADPTRLILKDHQEIVIAYGTPPAKIPKGHDFTPVDPLG